MFGGFALFTPLDRLAKLVGACAPESKLRPRYNVALGACIAAVHQASEYDQPINARVETVATNAYFKSVFSRHRSLIPADDRYEWIKDSKPKQPHYICRHDREPLFFPGIFAESDDGSMGCAIVTEPGRVSAAEVHDRMPLILNDDSLKH